MVTRRRPEDEDDATAASEAAEAAADDKPKTIWVRSKLAAKPDGGHVVALFESDPAHPKGQAYVAGPTPVEVAETPGVSAAIHSQQIEELSASEAKAEIRKSDEAKSAARAEARAEAGAGA